MLYWNLFKNAFMSNFAYKADTVARGIKALLKLIMQISVWTAIYSVGTNETLNNNTDLQEMICYVIVSTGISILVGKSNILMIDNKIRTGNIAMDIIKPLSFRKYIFSVAIGENIYNLVFQFVPMLIIASLLIRIKIPQFSTIIYFGMFLTGAILIRFLSGYLLGLLGFWYVTIWHLDRVLSDLISLFAGSFLPLWLFPEWLKDIADWLPFKFIYYIPISVFLGKINVEEFNFLLLQMVGWIAVLYFGGTLIWKLGYKSLVVQGG